MNGSNITTSDDDEDEDAWYDAEEAYCNPAEDNWVEWIPSEEEQWEDPSNEEAYWEENGFQDATEGNWWKECRQWQLPPEAIPKVKKVKRDRTKPDPIGFPYALMMLGMIMWLMQTVEMVFKTISRL